MKKALRINFVDFWQGFNKTDNYFYNLLDLRYKLEIDEHNPQLLFFSCEMFGNEHNRYDRSKCIKVFYTGENVRPDFSTCDYAFSFEYLEDPRNYRLPLWALYLDWFGKNGRNREPSYLVPPENLIKDPNLDFELIRSSKNMFCGFLYWNPSGRRIDFFHSLSTYKLVHSAGSLLNNCGFVLGGDELDKLRYASHFKFFVSFENSSYPGYVTEKIVHPMIVNTIPIYWGSRRIDDEFNPKSFLSLHDYSNEQELIEEIAKIDNDDLLYKSYLEEPWFPNNEYPNDVLPENVLRKLQGIIEA